MRRDLVVFVAMIAVAILVESVFRLDQIWLHWFTGLPWLGQQHEKLSLILDIVALGLTVIVFRRWRDLRAEMAEHRRSEQWFRSLIEYGSDIITILDAEGTIRYASPSIERMLGFTPEELLGRSGFELVHPDDRAEARQAFESVVRENRPLVMQSFRSRHKDGSWRVLESVGQNLLAEPGIGGVVVSSRDVTERERAREEFIASERRYEVLFNQMVAGFALHEVVCDEHGQPADFRFLDVNPAFERLTGFPREQVIGRTALEVIPDIQPELIERYGRVALTGEPAHFEHRAVALGKDFEVSAFSHVPGQFAVTFRDVTERKAAETALRESEERYKRLIESTTSYIYTVQVKDGRAVATVHGAGCAAITGYTAVEYEANPYLWVDMIHVDDRAAVVEQARQALAGQTPPTLEHRITHKDGSVRWISNTIALHKNERGELLSYDGLVSDITRRKHVEESLRNLVAGAAHARGKDFFPLLARHLAAALGVRYVMVNELVKRNPDRFRPLTILDGDQFTPQGEYDAEGTPCGQALSAREPCFIADHAAERFPNFKILADMGVQSYLGIALRNAEGQAIGALAALHDQPLAEPEQAKAILSIFAAHAAAELEHQRAEVVLAKANEMLGALIRSSPLAIAVIDPNGRVMLWNPAAERMFGWTEQEALGKPPLPVGDDNRAEFEMILASALRGETVPTLETRRRTKSGNTIDMALSTAALRDPNGHPFAMVSLMADITDRKKLAAREASRLWQLKHLSKLSLMLSGDPATVFERVVCMMGELFGVKVVCLSQIAGRELLFRTVYVDGKVLSNAGRCLLDITPCAAVEESKELRIYDRVQERFPQATFLRDHNAHAYCGFPVLDSKGRVVAVTCLLDDKPHEFTEEDQHILWVIGQRIATEMERGKTMAERQRAEEEMKTLSSAVEQTADSVVITNRDGIIEYVNPTFEKLTGYTREEALGRTPRILKSGKQDPRLYEQLWQTILSGQMFRMELANCKKNGELYYEAKTISPIRDAAGNITHFVATGKDITERKRAGKELQLQSSALHAAANGISITDREGVILFANAAFTSITGYSAEEAIGKTHRILRSGQHSKEFYDDMYRVVSSGQVFHGEMINRRKDGSLYPDDMTITPVRNAAGEITHHVAIRQDITERKQAEAASRASQRRLSDILESMFVFVGLFSLEGVLLEVNRAPLEAGGVRREDVIGQVFWETYWWNHAPESQKKVREAIDGAARGEVVRGDFEVRMKDDQSAVVDATFCPLRDETGRIVQVIGSGVDVTERKRAEAAIAELHQQQQALLDNIPDIAWLKDNSGRYIAVNQAFSRACGRRPGELAGKTDFDIWGRELAERHVAADRQVVESRQSQRVEEPMADAQGKEFWIDTIRTPIIDERGEVVGTTGIARDITDFKHTEAALRESNRRLQQALTNLKAAEEHVIQQQRLRALGTMASGIAHDFNNSLAAILGWSELLIHRPETLTDRDRALHYLGMIHTSAKDASRVVERLREFYRHRQTEEVMAPVDAAKLIQQSVALTQPMWKAQAEARNVSIAVETDAERVPLIAGNEAVLREALTNLILNSVDAMPEGGTITVRARADDGHVIIEVADTGTGMTEEVRRRCLEPFFTTKGERGTGLGLSMVYGIVKRHDGDLTIDTALGRGTTFRIRLPRHQDRPTSAAAPASVSTAPAQPLRVLVVDDEPQLCGVLVEFMAGDGHRVETAHNGDEALAKFRAGEFDVAILDRAMPKMSGDQLAAAIKLIEPGIPVILLTGFGVLMAASGETPPNIDLVVAKPVTIDELRLALAKTAKVLSH